MCHANLPNHNAAVQFAVRRVGNKICVERKPVFRGMLHEELCEIASRKEKQTNLTNESFG